MNIIKFPDKMQKHTSVLDKQLKLLRLHHSNITKTLQILNKHKKLCVEDTIKYDSLFLEYTSRVGIDNTDIKYINAASAVKPKVEGDGVIYVLE